MDYLLSLADNVFNYLMSIRIKDLLDIGILAVMVYQVLKFSRRSNMSGVIKGVGVVLLAVLLAGQFQLNALSFLLNRVVEIGVLALIVVFQPEIRHWLEQMGRGVTFERLLNWKTFETTTIESAIQETVYAYTSMSRDKVGALIVFERRNSLEEIVRSGTAMDCSVNAELLKNLFWNKAPLHDGAVVIRDGRIVSAGCMLPMSNNANLSKDLGMRHRAGIGISERSDAVVAIVSEETGGISVAVGGMLKRHLSSETLERVLKNELLPEQQEQENLAQRIRSRVKKGKDRDQGDV